jgi:pimeloyl-ACP methyl ester carboxylesterase
MAEHETLRSREQAQKSGNDLVATAPRFYATPTADIAYREIGSGPPLVLLHGWPLSGLTYRQLIPYLAGRFTCYAVDLPGGARRVGETTTTSASGARPRISRD